MGEEPVGLTRNLVYTQGGVIPIDTAIENADNPPEPDPVGDPQGGDGGGPSGGEGKPPKPKPGKPNGKPPRKLSESEVRIADRLWRQLQQRVY